jgi:hypothetical protein
VSTLIPLSIQEEAIECDADADGSSATNYSQSQSICDEIKMSMEPRSVFGSSGTITAGSCQVIVTMSVRQASEGCKYMSNH